MTNTTLIQKLRQLPVKLFKIAVLALYSVWQRYRNEKLVKRANRLSKLENRKYMVTRLYGQPICVSKQYLKECIRRRQIIWHGIPVRIKKGTTIESFEKVAYYITN
jgi:hypothetical protein